MGCLQRLGQPQRRGDPAVAGRNAGEHTTDEHATCGYNTPTATHAPAEEAEEEEKQRLVVSGCGLNPLPFRGEGDSRLWSLERTRRARRTRGWSSLTSQAFP
jgi:hypothetical protein